MVSWTYIYAGEDIPISAGGETVPANSVFLYSSPTMPGNENATNIMITFGTPSEATNWATPISFNNYQCLLDEDLDENNNPVMWLTLPDGTVVVLPESITETDVTTYPTEAPPAIINTLVESSGYDYGGGGGACVAVESFLPDSRQAGDIRVGDTMMLADEKTLEPGHGVVSYSERKTQPGFRIVTESGVALRCSATAPIPTPEGLVLAPNLLGKKVAVSLANQAAWETVSSVEPIGDIEVQHITVGDKCFWAGESAGSYILHHNIKMAGGGDGGDGGDDWWA